MEAKSSSQFVSQVVFMTLSRIHHLERVSLMWQASDIGIDIENRCHGPRSVAAVYPPLCAVCAILSYSKESSRRQPESTTVYHRHTRRYKTNLSLAKFYYDRRGRELMIPSNPLSAAESTGTWLTIYIWLYQNPCLSQVLQHRTDFPSPYSEHVVRPARQDRTG
jgi:hypothetical protein